MAGALAALSARIEVGLGLAFGYPITVAVREWRTSNVWSRPIRSRVWRHPGDQTLRHLSRAPGREQDEDSTRKRKSDLRLIHVTPGEVLSAITLSPGWGTTELMALPAKGVRSRRDHAQLVTR